MSRLAGLEREPYRYGFFAALRLLECAHADRPRIGSAARPGDEPVRIGQEPSLIFAPSSLASFRGGADGRPAELAVHFLGLFGPNGPLPLHLTEYARDRRRNHDDETFARFCDVFHHRLLSLFYRAWAQAQPTVQFDRPGDDRFATYVGALFGLGTPGLRDRDELPDRAKLHFAGHLAGGSRHPDGLRAILAGFFEAPVAIEEFVGLWIPLPRRARCRLGASPATGSLGTTAVVGSRIWDAQQKFRIRIGPVGIDRYRALLPGSGALERMRAAVRNYVGDEMIWDVRIVLRKEDVPVARLGQRGRLGWTSWLAGPPRENDADDLVLHPGEA